MKTKRLAAVLAAVLAFACCAGAWGDLLLPDQAPERYKPRLIEWELDQIVEQLKPSSDDVQADSEQQGEETLLLVYVFPKEALLVLRFSMEGPGEYEYTLCNDEGQVVMSNKGINRKIGANIVAKAACNLAIGEMARYSLDASFTPYRYQDTNFGPKLLVGPDGGPLTARRQELKTKFTVKNVKGRARIRKDREGE